MAAMTVDLGSADVCEEKDASLSYVFRGEWNGPAGRKRCTQPLLQGMDGEPHTKVICTTYRAGYAQWKRVTGYSKRAPYLSKISFLEIFSGTPVGMSTFLPQRIKTS
jgi:hypothetical protein